MGPRTKSSSFPRGLRRFRPVSSSSCARTRRHIASTEILFFVSYLGDVDAISQVPDCCPRYSVKVGNRRDRAAVEVDKQVRENGAGHDKEGPAAVLEELEVGRHSSPVEREVADHALHVVVSYRG